MPDIFESEIIDLAALITLRISSRSREWFPFVLFRTISDINSGSFLIYEAQ